MQSFKSKTKVSCKGLGQVRFKSSMEVQNAFMTLRFECPLMMLCLTFEPQMPYPLFLIIMLTFFLSLTPAVIQWMFVHHMTKLSLKVR